MDKKRKIFVIVIILLASLNTFSLLTNQKLRSKIKQMQNVTNLSIDEQITKLERSYEGRKMDEVFLPSLKDKENSEITFEKNEYTIVAIFSSLDCNRCFEIQAAELNDLYNSYSSDKFSIFGIFSRHSKNIVVKIVKIFSLNFPIKLDEEGIILSNLNLSRTPLLLFVDSNSKIIYAHIPDYTNISRSEEFFTKLRRLLN